MPARPINHAEPPAASMRDHVHPPQRPPSLCPPPSPSFVPSLNWVERAYRQAKKHIAAAEPRPLAELLWAWGEWGYSPRDKPFVNALKMELRRQFKRRQLGGRELVMVMHGISRVDPEYWPNLRWMAAFARQAQGHLMQLPTGGCSWELLL